MILASSSILFKQGNYAYQELGAQHLFSTSISFLPEQLWVNVRFTLLMFYKNIFSLIKWPPGKMINAYRLFVIILELTLQK